MILVCPICKSTSLIHSNTHERWKVPILRCTSCHHQFVSESKHNDEEDSFSTNRKRASLYFQEVESLNLAQVVDIGTPRDFFFLSKVHKKWPECDCIALDLYEKSHPSYIRLIHNFEFLKQSRVDLLTAFHVLEHVEDIHQIISKIDSASRWFIVEVPHCDSDLRTRLSSTAPHVHFFNKSSFESAFRDVDCQIAVHSAYDMPDDCSVLVAYRLPFRLNLEGSRSFDSVVARELTKKVSYFKSFGRAVKGLKRRVKQVVCIKPAKKAKNIEPKTILPNPGGYHRLSHVASFTAQGSNAGDILLPAVLRDLFLSQSKGIDWTSFHAHNAVTDEVVQKINASQGLIIGGGGLFLRDTNKNNISGWQWPCSVEHLKAIKVPICVFAVGYNRFRGQEEFDTIFADNLKTLAEKSVFIGLRNSGSIKAIRSYLPMELQEKVRFQPCMTTLISRLYPDLFEAAEENSDDEPFISLNCAFDRAGLRFGARKAEVLQEIANGVLQLMKKTGLSLKYYAHYGADFEMIDVLKQLVPRFDVYDLSQLSSPEIIAAYKAPALALGMRGHAQMIPFGCQTPILSLVSHDKLQWFLDDIGQPDWSADLREGNIAASIVEKGSEILNSRRTILNVIEVEQKKLWDISQINMQDFFKTLPA